MFKFIKVFLVSFVLIFAVLNGRFLYANVNYWLGSGTAPIYNQPSPSPSLTIAEKTPLPDRATLIIEKLGISAPLVFGVNSDNDTIFKNLENGVVHYSNTPKPGLDGVSIILGHSSAYPWYKGAYGSVFALLGKLQPGDKFSVRYADGRTFNFAIKQSVVFSPFADDSRLTQIEKTPGTSLVLVSCWPVGTNYKRIAVQAELI
ncbi:MAG: sortase [Candidatus Yanofskybacteria bacterium]|nr:sortase [Candidatus Yanofskybacteria bacterium]